MKYISIMLSIISSGVLGLGCSSIERDRSSGHATYTAPGSFSMDLPQGASVKRVDTQADFTIYDVEMDKATLLHIYVGNHPDFPIKNGQGPTEKLLMTSSTCKLRTFWDSTKLVGIEA